MFQRDTIIRSSEAHADLLRTHIRVAHCCVLLMPARNDRAQWTFWHAAEQYSVLHTPAPGAQVHPWLGAAVVGALGRVARARHALDTDLA
jgi:hypothetical protein